MVTINEFIEKLKEALEISDPDLKPGTSFRDLQNWSSMNALIILAMFETEFDVTLTGEDLKKCSTVEDLYNVLPK